MASCPTEFFAFDYHLIIQYIEARLFASFEHDDESKITPLAATLAEL